MSGFADRRRRERELAAALAGRSPNNWWSVSLAVLLFSLFSPGTQTLLARFALLFGWVGAIVLATFANAIVIDIILNLTPGMVVGDF